MSDEKNIENSELENQQSSVKDQQHEKISQPELQTSNLPAGQAGIDHKPQIWKYISTHIM